MLPKTLFFNVIFFVSENFIVPFIWIHCVTNGLSNSIVVVNHLKITLDLKSLRPQLMIMKKKSRIWCMHYYKGVLQRLREYFKKETRVVERQFITTMYLLILLCQLLSIFSLSPKLKLVLKGRCFDIIDDIKRNSLTLPQTFKTKLFSIALWGGNDAEKCVDILDEITLKGAIIWKFGYFLEI